MDAEYFLHACDEIRESTSLGMGDDCRDGPTWNEAMPLKFRAEGREYSRPGGDVENGGAEHRCDRVGTGDTAEEEEKFSGFTPEKGAEEDLTNSWRIAFASASDWERPCRMKDPNMSLRSTLAGPKR